MSNAKAILIGFAMLSLGVAFQPVVGALFVGIAHAQLSSLDLKGVERQLSIIASAINNLLLVDCKR